VIDKLTDLDITSVQTKLATLGTIDLRTDYLRPGKGESFTASATLIRSGNKVCVCRMELHNEQSVQIAFGTGTYLVG
ncbi:thioesterase family protein, partial [Pseudoalteromonas sp. 19-MNA-CIBAN-0066]